MKKHNLSYRLLMDLILEFSFSCLFALIFVGLFLLTFALEIN